jgi:hypothetical protein
MIIYEAFAQGYIIYTDWLSQVATQRAKVPWNSFFTMKKLTSVQRKNDFTQS